jgi:hypothetical protein
MDNRLAAIPNKLLGSIAAFIAIQCIFSIGLLSFGQDQGQGPVVLDDGQAKLNPITGRRAVETACRP